MAPMDPLADNQFEMVLCDFQRIIKMAISSTAIGMEKASVYVF